MNARGIGGVIVGLIGIALIIAAVGSQTCRWVAPGADVKTAIEQGDTVFAEGRSFECTKRVDGTGGLFLLAIGIAGVVGCIYLLVAATKAARAEDVKVRTETGMGGTVERRPPSSHLVAPLFLQQINASSPACEGWWDCYRGVSIAAFIIVAALVLAMWSHGRWWGRST